MDWENERWVKLYVRDTPEFASLPFVTRSVAVLLLKHVGFDGELRCGMLGRKAIAHVLRVDYDMIAESIQQLIDIGTLEVSHDESLITMRNFRKAQDARQSAMSRQRAWRERKRYSVSTMAQNGTETLHGVSKTLRDVTKSNAVSTPCRRIERERSDPSDQVTETCHRETETDQNTEQNSNGVKYDQPEKFGLSNQASDDASGNAKRQGNGKQLKLDDGTKALSSLAWKAWRELYPRSVRRYGEYVEADDDGKSMKRIVTLVVQETLRELRARALPETHFLVLAAGLLDFWFKEYLRDDGAGGYLANQRHVLRYLPRTVTKYGTPWSRKPLSIAATTPDARRVLAERMNPEGNGDG